LTNRTTAFVKYSALMPKDLVGLLLIGRLKKWTLTWFHMGCSYTWVYHQRKNIKYTTNI